jgi:endonuclease-3 related protein
MHPTELYEILSKHFGPQHWWPGDSQFETIVGAVLTQQAAWSNAAMAVQNLKNTGMLDLGKIANSGSELEELIHPSRFYRQKAVYLRALCAHIMEHYGGNLDAMFSKSLETLRPEFLALKGIGPETADSILLYAGNKLTFVVDAYTIRACQRTGLFDSGKYNEIKEFFEKNVEPDIAIYNEFHALIVALCMQYCTSRSPKCRECPVNKSCNHALSEK